MSDCTPSAPRVGTPGTLHGCRILVVEDDYLIGLDAADVLMRAGAHVVGPVGWIADALAVLAADAPPLQGALLDISLHGVLSYAVADALVMRAIPFVFTTAFDAAGIHRQYRHHPFCTKPLDYADTVLALILAGAGSGGEASMPG